MKPPLSRAPLTVLLTVTLAAGLLATGCASGQFGSELSAQPTGRKIGDAAGTTIRLPADQPLNITLSKSTREPGLEGSADANASAQGSGQATATATVTGGGKAEALFQLGHALTNATERQTDFECAVRFEYEFDAQAAADLRLPDTTIGLRLYARNSQGRVLRDMPIVTHTTENGPAKRHSTENLGFTLTLAPNETVNLFLAGQTKIDAPDARSAAGTLKLSNLMMEIQSRPAPAVRTAGHEPR